MLLWTWLAEGLSRPPRRTLSIQSLYDVVMRETPDYPYWDTSEPAQRHSRRHLTDLKDRGLYRLVAAVGQQNFLRCYFRFMGWVSPLPHINCLCPSLTLHKKQYLQAGRFHATSAAAVQTSHFQTLHELWSPLHMSTLGQPSYGVWGWGVVFFLRVKNTWGSLTESGNL